MAVALFGGFLTVLSLRYLIAVQVVTLALWLATSSLVVPTVQVLPVLTMNLLAAGLGIVTLQRRIATFRRIHRLESRVEALESILPMCSGCKKTQDDKGQWHSVESYIETRDEGLQVSHGLCPDCKEHYFGDYLRGRERNQTGFV